MNEPVIEMQQLKKTYKDKRFRSIEGLKGIDLLVNEGEAFGFIGPNGAGKTTTIKILTGSLRPSSGEAKVFGFSVESHLSRQGMGYVAESPYLYDYLTPLEMLVMGLKLHGVKVDSPENYCLKWLERFSLGDVAKKPIRSFSKGMTQRTALAHAMAIKPKLLILDEPLSGLDPIGRKDVVDILVDYRKQGGSIFFSSHVLHDVERLADRFGLIHQGNLKTISQPSELSSGDDRVIVRSHGEQVVVGMTRDVGFRWYADIASSDLWPLLNQLERQGHNLIEVKPALSLETAFLKFVTSTDASTGNS